MFNVRVYYERTWIEWSYALRLEAEDRIRHLRGNGFFNTSKAGIITYYLPHRITKITARRVVNGRTVKWND